MASIEPREAGQVRRGDVVTIANGTRLFDVTQLDDLRGTTLARVWPVVSSPEDFDRGQWVGIGLLKLHCPEPARSGAEQAEHDTHCCECGTTAPLTYRSRGGYRRCVSCDVAHVRTLQFTSSGRALPLDR